jgi:hypothetical protein
MTGYISNQFHYYLIIYQFSKSNLSYYRIQPMKHEITNTYLQEERFRKRRRLVLRILSILLILIGWSIPLLIIIDMIPNNLFLLFLGTGLIWGGTIVQLLISSGEI